MKFLGSLADRAATLLIGAASLALLFLLGVVVTDVIARALNPTWRIYGTLDYVELSLDWVIFLAIPAALFRGQIVVVDIVDGIFASQWMQFIGYAVTLAVLLFLVGQVIRPALAMLEWREKTIDLGLLKFLYWIPIWFGLGLSVLATAIRTVLCLRSP